MSKSKLKRLLIRLASLARTMMLAYMIGIANIVKQEVKYIEDSHTKIEYRQESTDDEPFEELDDEA